MHTYESNASISDNFLVITFSHGDSVVVMRQVCTHATPEISLVKMNEHLSSLTQTQMAEFFPKENVKVEKPKKEKVVEAVVAETLVDLKAVMSDAHSSVFDKLHALAKANRMGLPLAYFRGVIAHLATPTPTPYSDLKTEMRDAKKTIKDTKASFDDRVAALAFVSQYTDFTQDVKGFLFADLVKLLNLIVNDYIKETKLNDTHDATGE